MFRWLQHFTFEEDIEDPRLDEADSNYAFEAEELRSSAASLQNSLDLAVEPENSNEASHKAECSENHKPEMAELWFERGRTIRIRSGSAFQYQHRDRFRDGILEDENPAHRRPAFSATFSLLLSSLESNNVVSRCPIQYYVLEKLTLCIAWNIPSPKSESGTANWTNSRKRVVKAIAEYQSPSSEI